MKVNCSFKNITLGNSTVYTCIVIVESQCKYNAPNTKPNMEIKSFHGVHQPGRSSSDVKAISFERSFDRFFLRGLHMIFPNLESLKINDVGLSKLTRRDLIGLENLQELQLCSNNLTTLPNNLFADMRKLKKISLAQNQIDNISSQLFTPIIANELTLVDLSGN